MATIRQGESLDMLGRSLHSDQFSEEEDKCYCSKMICAKGEEGK